MKIKPISKNLQLLLFTLLIVTWGIAAAFLLMYLTPLTSLLGIAVFIFIAVFTMTQLFPYAAWGSFAVGLAFYMIAALSMVGFNREFLISAGVGSGISLISVLIFDRYTHFVNKISQRNDHLEQVVDSLLIYDQHTSLMRWKYARQILSSEVSRGKRYKSSVSLVLFEIRSKHHYSESELNQINQTIADIIQNSTRVNIDIGFINHLIGLVLPETNHIGAEVLSDRLIKKFNQHVDAQVVAGISNYPELALTEEDIIIQAKEALRASLLGDQVITCYHEFAEELPEPAVEDQDESHDVVIFDQKQPQDDYVAILESLNLDEDEWVVWIEGFNQLSDLELVEDKLKSAEHVKGVEFLFPQANHIVLRIKTSIDDLTTNTTPFPGWLIKKSFPKYRYLLIARDENTLTANPF